MEETLKNNNQDIKTLYIIGFIAFTPIFITAFIVKYIFNAIQISKIALVTALLAGAGLAVILKNIALQGLLAMPYILQNWITAQGGPTVIDIDFTTYKAILGVIICSIPIAAILALMADNHKTVNKQEQAQQQERMLNSKFQQHRIDQLLQAEPKSEGVFAGVDMLKREQIIITDRELNQHCCIAGTTGSGKTETLYNFVEHACLQGLPAIIVNGKGDISFANKIQAIAKAHNRTVREFNLGNGRPSQKYNPIYNGNPTSIADKLMLIGDYTEPHYFNMANNYMLLAAKILFAAGWTPDFDSLMRRLPYSELVDIVAQAQESGLLTDDWVKKAMADLQKLERDANGTIYRLQILKNSEVGDLFVPQEGNTIILQEALKNGEIILFNLNAVAYESFTETLGRLILGDIRDAVSSTGQKLAPYIPVILDEFSSFATDRSVGLLNKTRSYGVCAILATQSFADLDTVSRTLKEQIIQNCNTFIFHRANSPTDAELMAKIVGSEQVYEMNMSTDAEGTLKGQSWKTVEAFKAHPNLLKEMPTGQAIVYRKAHPSGKVLVHHGKMRMIKI